MKITIIYKSDSDVESQAVFDDQALIRIGRDKSNDLVFMGDIARAISGHHAEILVSEDGVKIRDAGSTNGLWLEGRRVVEVGINNGDVITLGQEGPSIKVCFDQTKSTPGGHANLSPSAPKIYGERTVGMMIRRILGQVGAEGKTGTSKSTGYFEQLIDRQFKKTSSRVKWLVVMIVVLVGVGTGFGIYLYQNRSVQYIQTTQVNYGDAAGSSVAAANRYNVFLMAGKKHGTDVLEGFCTAFAVSGNVLVTNAHCIQTGEKKYHSLTVLMNSAPSNRYPVARTLIHEGYRSGNISPDVGVMVIYGMLSQYAVIAPASELAQVVPGMPMFSYGFPGRLSDVSSPEATFVTGEIGRVTGFDQTFGDYGKNTLLQHSAFSATGTSGSPIFNSSGRVVGLNAGGYVQDDQVLTGYNFAIRIDLIYSLTARLENGG